MKQINISYRLPVIIDWGSGIGVGATPVALYVDSHILASKPTALRSRSG